MNHKFGNAARTARFNSAVLRWTCLAILLLFGIALLPTLAAHPGSLVAAGMLGTVLGARPHSMRFFEADKDAVTLMPEEKDALIAGAKGWKTVAQKADELELKLKSVASIEEVKALKKEFDDILAEFRKSQRKQLVSRSGRPLRKGQCTDEVARDLGALCVAAAIRQRVIGGTKADFLGGLSKDIIGDERFKSALTSSDIPLPVEYSGDIVELVYQFGKARQLGTVYPLGGLTTKLPKLTTDPTFGLIAASGTVTEKSPQAGFVTFTAEKFGGLIRLPSEIDEDSIIALGQFLARYSARNMAKAEDWNFFRGTGAASGVNGTAKGLTTTVVDDSIVINQASTKTKQSDATLQNLRDLRSSSGLNGAALDDACYIMHPTYEALLCTFNTSATVTPYQRSGPGAPATLDGFPINWVSSMPAFSTTASASLCHVLFGDPTFQYLGVRGAMRFDTSMEAGFTTDEILVRALERFTTGKMATDAVAGLVTAAS